MSKKTITVLLSIIILLSLFFSIYKFNQVPPCLNADEVAFGYNSYSLLKTGRDEYGKFLPLRLESFEDYKLPLYTYLTVPIMAIFGYNDATTRALNIIVMVMYIPLVYLLTKEWWNDERIALLASFLTSVTPGFYILTRHAHEGPLTPLFILFTLLFTAKFFESYSVKYFVFAEVSILLATFSYHYGRLFLLFILAYQVVLFIQKRTNFQKKITSTKKLIGIAIFIIVLILPFATDAFYSLNRVQNLLFFKDQGFQLRLDEYLIESSNRIIHNKLTQSIVTVANNYFAQISPEFFIINGDKNWRFGMTALGPLNPIVYLFFFIGLYYLFKNKEKYRFLLLFLFAISPVSNALTWQGPSLIRTYFILFPMIFASSYGLIHMALDIKKNNKNKLILIGVYALIIVTSLFFFVFSWDLYFFHYPKRATTVRAWQCGYKELVEYVKKNYDNYDNFYITDQQGQPYIFFLHYLKYDPKKYQMQAKISAPDGYGFGQVANFDKFHFEFSPNKLKSRTVIIGYPDEFNNLAIPESKITKIKIRTEDMFWIYAQD